MSAKKSIHRLRAAHPDLFSQASRYATAFGMDPKGEGENGIVISVFADDPKIRKRALEKARGAIGDTWEIYPVYYRGTGVPRAY